MKVTRKKGPGDTQLKTLLKNIGDKVGKVGWFPTAKYSIQTKESSRSFPVAAVAAINEFGWPAKNIPARSFIRTTTREKRNDWRALATKNAKDLVKGVINSEQAMQRQVLVAQGDIKEKITTVQSPALKQTTVDARLRKRSNGKVVGSLTKPLVDTAVMLNTLTSTVESK